MARHVVIVAVALLLSMYSLLTLDMLVAITVAFNCYLTSLLLVLLPLLLSRAPSTPLLFALILHTVIPLIPFNTHINVIYYDCSTSHC